MIKKTPIFYQICFVKLKMLQTNCLHKENFMPIGQSIRERVESREEGKTQLHKTFHRKLILQKMLEREKFCERFFLSIKKVKNQNQSFKLGYKRGHQSKKKRNKIQSLGKEEEKIENLVYRCENELKIYFKRVEKVVKSQLLKCLSNVPDRIVWIVTRLLTTSS